MSVPRETDPLTGLHSGWPFGDGPDQWPWTVEQRPATDIQPAGAHLVCGRCDQSITRLGTWAHRWAALKPQVAAHVMQVHSDHVTG